MRCNQSLSPSIATMAWVLRARYHIRFSCYPAYCRRRRWYVESTSTSSPSGRAHNRQPRTAEHRKGPTFEGRGGGSRIHSSARKICLFGSPAIRPSDVVKFDGKRSYVKRAGKQVHFTDVLLTLLLSINTQHLATRRAVIRAEDDEDNSEDGTTGRRR